MKVKAWTAVGSRVILAAVFALVAVFFLSVHTGQAASSTKIVLDDREVTGARDVLTVSGTTMVPIRVISEELGYSVGWNKTSKQITISGSREDVQLTLGSKSARSAEGTTVSLEQAPLLRSNTTYVPLRFVGTQMGLAVKWDNSAKTVYLTSRPDSGAPLDGVGPNDDVDPPEQVPGGVPNTAAQVEQISFSENRLLIGISGDTQPNVTAIDSPNRIVIDLPNTSFSPLFAEGQGLLIGQQGQISAQTSADVTAIRFALNNDSPMRVRVVIDLNKTKGYQVYREGSLIFVDLNKQGGTSTPGVGGDGKKIVVIDPGHGGKATGAIYKGDGLTLQEKDVNLQMALKVEQLLKQVNGLDVVLTRSDDTDVSLQGRVDIAENLNADIMVSIHANSMPVGSKATSGTETLYTKNESKLLAQTIHKYVIKATGLPDRKAKYQNLHVDRESNLPTALVETGFLYAGGDVQKLTDPQWQDRVAQAIVDGIVEYLGL
ncbi:N-acetylmuramoyl-L-alanine amidase family protein [Saccharibacillus sp. CPCC 101409]|uniref:N-acetylmuramoyl-L-alanine amidase family protein n=1 Tax=Saccharibacillus sp. CPCC 101409 TaxID=3058041 RepID=UPI0026734F1E|nr:N-acetylmuramoyl-L-alanine amidase family protein [Saccharibacillus sp. CPCC 101409]MDO3408225.1 N-acetylmuramoyl-L-alanine amidase family protein [Saccharibacillus sp. CPCC 101409]